MPENLVARLDMLVELQPVVERTLLSPRDSLEVNISTLRCCHRPVAGTLFASPLRDLKSTIS